MQAITDIADRIFLGAKCQRDLDARKGDFIAECIASGIKIRAVGAVWRCDPPVFWFGGLQNVAMSGWWFESPDGAK